MPIEIVGGMISPFEGGEGGNGALTAGRGAGRRAFDTDYITRFVRAHESSGFDTALVGYGATSPDGFSIASHALHVTDKLGVLIAHRPGFAQPTPTRSSNTSSSGCRPSSSAASTRSVTRSTTARSSSRSSARPRRTSTRTRS